MMIKRFVLVAAIALLHSGSASARESATRLDPRTGAPPGVDWSGVWQPERGTGDWHAEDAPLTPEYRAKYEKVADSVRRGEPAFEPAAGCVPLGMPRFMSVFYGMEIWHRPGALGIYAELPGFLRRIFTDGRPKPNLDDLESTYYGYSVGHWEGKDLLVDTWGIHGGSLLMLEGVEESDAASVHEVLHQVDANTLTDTLTLTDPKALTRPWTIVKTYKRSPDVDMMEFFCFENNRQIRNPDGSNGIIIKTQ